MQAALEEGDGVQLELLQVGQVQELGRELGDVYSNLKRNDQIGDVVLEVQNFPSINPRSFRDINFQLRKGEILGVAGIAGCGQKELLEAIAGLQPVENGTIKYIDNDVGVHWY